MALTREKFEELGGAFATEESSAEIVVAEFTHNDRTLSFQGTSEKQVLAEAEATLLRVGVSLPAEEDEQSLDEDS